MLDYYLQILNIFVFSLGLLAFDRLLMYFIDHSMGKNISKKLFFNELFKLVIAVIILGFTKDHIGLISVPFIIIIYGINKLRLMFKELYESYNKTHE